MDYDDIPIRRSYDREVVRRLTKWHTTAYANALEELGKVAYGSHTYPLFMLHRSQLSRSRRKGPTVMLSAGVHGDEPAGVYALLDFLNGGMREYGDRCNFVVFPCVNPSGFEADTREAMTGKNLNRLFGTGSDQEEVCSIERWLAETSSQFRLAIGLHETPPYDDDESSEGEDNPRACYLYETMPDVRRRIGRALIDALPEGAEVCQWPTIYEDTNDRGVISYPEGCHNPVFLRSTTLEDYLCACGAAEHSLVTETPTVWSLEKRVAVQRLWLRRALDLVLAKG